MNLEAAQALKAAGYPQDEWPQAVWHTGALTLRATLRHHDRDARVWLEPEIASCEEPDVHCAPGSWADPDLLSVLDWFLQHEEIDQIRYSSDAPKFGLGAWSVRFSKPNEQGRATFEVETADDLIVLICKRIVSGVNPSTR